MRPAFLQDNLVSEMQYPAHVVAASSVAVGHDVWRVANCRRSPRDYWTPAAANVEAHIAVDCGEERVADMVVLDRGHNLTGRSVVVERSSDGMVWVSVATAVVPSVSSGGSLLDAADGVRTREGAWMCRWASVAARYWRLRIPAMGAGLRPIVVGLWIGESWRPSQFFDFPFSDDARDLRYQAATSDRGWTGLGTVSRPRVGQLQVKLGSTAEHVDATRHIVDGFWRPRPMWIVFSDARAESAVLALPAAGRVGWDHARGWGHRQSAVEWIEHEPWPGS